MGTITQEYAETQHAMQKQLCELKNEVNLRTNFDYQFFDNQDKENSKDLKTIKRSFNRNSNSSKTSKLVTKSMKNSSKKGKIKSLK